MGIAPLSRPFRQEHQPGAQMHRLELREARHLVRLFQEIHKMSQRGSML
jgi:hypothetical protein